MKKRVLLTGISGAIGEFVFDNLLKQSDKIEIIALSTDRKVNHIKLRKYESRAKIIYGDIREKSVTDKVAENIDFVIHTAAIIPPLANSNPELAEGVNHLGTSNLVKSIEEKSPNAFFLYTSSVAVYGDRLLNPEIRVSDELKPSFGDNYAVTKIKAEKVVQSSKLRWSIFRLAAIMHFKQKFDPLMFNNPLDTRMEICTTRDTAFALSESIFKEKELEGKIFNLGGGEKCRAIYRDFLNTSSSNSGLGLNAFPDEAFATANFHCGDYMDSDKLNDILHFQRDSIEDYYRMFTKEIGPVNIFLAKIFRPFIINYFLKKSLPLIAQKKNDKAMLERYRPSK